MVLDIDPIALLDEAERRRETRRLYRLYAKTWEQRESENPETWGPYPKQVAFHDMGADHDYRAFIANNRGGKSRSAAAEVAMHLTGWYPSWWKGKRFPKQNDWLVCGVTNNEVRDICQKALLGSIDETRGADGTGWVPYDSIGKMTFRQCGVSNVVDVVKVRHVSGKWSTVTFKSYEMGAVKFQGTEYNGVWMDEEPEQDDVFPEIQTRLLTRKGILMFTRTPLFGRTPIVDFFLGVRKPGVGHVIMTMEDSKHISDRDRLDFIARCPDHEKECRINGVPMLGEGAVFQFADSVVLVDPLPIPSHWSRICGIDFGIDHDQAACWLAYDRDNDVVYVVDEYKARNQTAAQHSAAVNARGKWIPVAWPHDGANREKATGETLIANYDIPGKLAVSARWDDQRGGGQSKEKFVQDVIERVANGTFKVFKTCPRFMEEKRNYHRKDNRVVASNDDLLSACAYGLMMLRYAVTKGEADGFNRQPDAVMDYDPLGRYMAA